MNSSKEKEHLCEKFASLIFDEYVQNTSYRSSNGMDLINEIKGLCEKFANLIFCNYIQDTIQQNITGIDLFNKIKKLCEKYTSLIFPNYIQDTIHQNITGMNLFNEIKNLCEKYTCLIFPNYIQDTIHQNITGIDLFNKIKGLCEEFASLIFCNYIQDTIHQDITEMDLFNKIKDLCEEYTSLIIRICIQDTFNQSITRCATIIDTSTAMILNTFEDLQKELKWRYTYKVRFYNYIESQTGYECGYIAISSIFDCFVNDLLKDSVVKFWNPGDTVNFFNFIIGRESCTVAIPLNSSQILKIVKVLSFTILHSKKLGIYDIKSAHNWYINNRNNIAMDNKAFNKELFELNSEWFGGVYSADGFLDYLGNYDFAQKKGVIVNTNNRNQGGGHWFSVVLDNNNKYFPNRRMVFHNENMNKNNNE